jgi:outer membrane protein OmpA-like peptidoglycan-associated protein
MLRYATAAAVAASLVLAATSAQAQVERCVGGETPAPGGAYVVLFDAGSAAVKDRARRELAQIASTARSRFANRICLDGFADATVGRQADLALARRRAEAVMNELAANGYPREKISIRNIVDPANAGRVGGESRTERKVEVRFGR